ncbi:hypothetical protein trd_0710 [Thermomicrobium roseum DSM 5159]|uniref:Uncharacterized protein n=1 Tax=Thermomicrobium roseum (strain ATCC 27502 / DSM 5159 / P-2) TaxID=309801 RepID=B9KZ01_THERP|nr:hypothetical protein trd_0710 [Thermomicrobium roseum DSM 5159]
MTIEPREGLGAELPDSQTQKQRSDVPSFPRTVRLPPRFHIAYSLQHDILRMKNPNRDSNHDPG